ncbi:peptidoglycan-binding protein [Kordiimonas sp. SCSIO 12610]|uniref:peptidoglycan-binding domain-containing protein n=1 Tax=Kordiimonas sp. SCSIO 12610 TaxID=2829597 RepID=UPI00210BF81D|nr:peptidoglycan-binding domain-containing protein [Kordiimonas sp. SCSIO 12610]UTW56204.1 peptidoglycan-binding protein [Kordiimonas sp. SCSIO 12610]
MLKIQQSVGIGSQNRPHDVAVIQLALRLHRTAGQGAYYSGAIDGNYSDLLHQAIVRFQFDNGLVTLKSKAGVIDKASQTATKLYRKFPAAWKNITPIAVADGSVVFYDFNQQKLEADLAKEIARIRAAAYLLPRYEKALTALMTSVLKEAKVLLKLDFKSRKIIHPGSFRLSLKSEPNRILKLLGGNLSVPTIQRQFSLLDFQKKVISSKVSVNDVWVQDGKIDKVLRLKSRISNYMAGPLYVTGVKNGLLELNAEGGNVDLDFTLHRRVLLKKQSSDPLLRNYETAYVYGTVIKLYREHADYTDDLSKVWFKEFLFNKSNYDEIYQYLKRKNNIFALNLSPLAGEIARAMTTETYALLADQLGAINSLISKGKLSADIYDAFQRATKNGDELAAFLLEDVESGSSKILLKLTQNTVAIITLGAKVQVDISKGIPADEAIIKNIAEFFLGKVPGIVSSAIVVKRLNLRLNKRFTSGQQVIITALASFFIDMAITYIIEEFSKKMRIEVGSITRAFYREHIKPALKDETS